MVESEIRPTNVALDFVLKKCDYFVDIQLWPRISRLNPEGWLSNFREGEREHAVHLLSAFLYFSKELIDEMFAAAFQRLSYHVVAPAAPFVQAQAEWDSFRREVLVTYVTGESPNDTDSGYLFARRARQQLNVDEHRIMGPDHVLQHLSDNGPRPVVFVDDFVGSGNQCRQTWHRAYPLAKGGAISFAKYFQIAGGVFFYCPVLCSDVGRQAINANCKGLRLSPAHFISRRYNAFDVKSLVWPDRLRSTATDFLLTASLRAGISEETCRGFQGLGLAIAFEHGVPDATIPIIYHDSNGWVPLVKRT